MSGPAVRFTDEQVRRYSRQLLLVDVGGRGQRRLLSAEVAVDVDGVAGRIAAVLLAAAGVGRVVLCGRLERLLGDEDGDASVPLSPDDRGRTLGDAMTQQLAARNGDVAAVLARTAPASCLRVDAGDGTLADAFARAGEAATRVVHGIATGADGPVLDGLGIVAGPGPAR
ncbi:MAG TPA: hypothetical protein VHE35_12000 [Kofleriaceae bacterium]|nr:hypothetical protein [Kofleriaceae bacterium]